MNVAEYELGTIALQFKPADAPDLILTGNGWFKIPEIPARALDFYVVPEVKTISIQAVDENHALDKAANDWKVGASFKEHMSVKAKAPGVGTAEGGTEGGIDASVGGSSEHGTDSTNKQQLDFQVSFMTGKLIVKGLSGINVDPTQSG
jgi:hypothetical protein